MDQSAFFGQLQSEAAARQSLAEALLKILQGKGAVDPALEDARLYGGEEMNQLLFGRSDFMPVLIPATRFGALRQLVAGRRLMPASDPLRPFVPPPELPDLPAPTSEHPPLGLDGYQDPGAQDPPAPAVLPPPPEPEAVLPPPPEPEDAVSTPSADPLPVAPPPAPPPADPEPEPPAPSPPAAPLPPPSRKETSMSDLSQFGSLASPLSASASPGAQADNQEQVVTAKFLQKVSTLVHSAMAARDTYADAVTEALGLPPAELDGLVSGKGQNVTLGTVVRVMLHLGAPNLALVVPAPRQPAAGGR